MIIASGDCLIHDVKADNIERLAELFARAIETPVGLAWELPDWLKALAGMKGFMRGTAK